MLLPTIVSMRDIALPLDSDIPGWMLTGSSRR
jgi:hypothetical protein